MKNFIKDTLHCVTHGGWKYHTWMGALSFFMLLGAYGYYVQFTEGLGATGMNDHVSWGIYISNFTFLVGVAAAAVMLVMPAYVLKDVDFDKAVLIGEGLAVAALVMCMAFVVVDLGNPLAAWHLLPGIGYLNFPRSLLAWDVIVLNGYLLLNICIPFYILYSRYNGRKPTRKKYVPFIYLSVFWAVGIHMVTAFLLAGLPARPFWNSGLMGPRFLASAFAAGPAFIIVALTMIDRFTAYRIERPAFDKLSMIIAVAAQINLIMLGSEMFKEFYHPTHHSLSAQYLFFGLHGHDALVPWMRTSLVLNVLATAMLTIHPLRHNRIILPISCVVLFIAIWIDKGMGLIVPGFIPSPLGEIVEYSPTWVEFAVAVGIWAMGFWIFTVLVRIAIPIELGSLRAPGVNKTSLVPDTSADA